MEAAPQVAQARSVPYEVLGLQPPAAEITNSSTDNSVPGWDKGKLMDVLVRGVRAAHHEPGHVQEAPHEHSQPTEHDKHQQNGDPQTGKDELTFFGVESQQDDEHKAKIFKRKNK